MEKENYNENIFSKLWKFYTPYEKIWFFSITILAFVFAFLFPEEDIGGINGKIIMTLYLIDILSNILCELLISKQSKWNFIVSIIFIEITESVLYFSIGAYSTALISIIFWIPIDIATFL